MVIVVMNYNGIILNAGFDMLEDVSSSFGSNVGLCLVVKPLMMMMIRRLNGMLKLGVLYSLA